MDSILRILEIIMDWCFKVCGNYGLAIILFTLISKIVLLPVSIWVQKNSIKMVRMQPELYEIKSAHYGDKDTIAELQAELYKKEKYNAFASVIPMIIQIALLIGLISVIKGGLSSGVETNFGGIELDQVPKSAGGLYLIIPFVAGGAAYLLCTVQNRVNVLQANSSIFEKYFTMAVSVGLSLYLGFYVQVGVIIYWIFSNLFGILQIFFLNTVINPTKYIDYERLEKAKGAFEELDSVGKKNSISKEDRKRERIDYKRFFSVVNKHLVFYSESNGFFKYYKGIIEYILEHTNLIIHYITSDPNDSIFETAKQNSRIRAYYIGEKRLITLMMKMDADVVCMTMPDLEKFHIKRSYVRDDIEYVYIPHGIGSFNLLMRKGCVDNYDTIFCTSSFQIEEVRKTEEVYGLKAKKLVEVGYPLLDDMRNSYNENKEIIEIPHDKKRILIGPSWQKDNIIDCCLEEMLDNLKDERFEITVRPHPQAIRHMKEYFETLQKRYATDGIVFQLDFSNHNSLFESDLVITDWSGTSYEFAYTTLKPAVFINTPPKIMNPDYKKIGIEPVDFTYRDVIGRSIDLNDISSIKKIVLEILDAKDEYRNIIDRTMRGYLFNIGNSAEIGAKYLINAVQVKGKQRRENE